ASTRGPARATRCRSIGRASSPLRRLLCPAAVSRPSRDSPSGRGRCPLPQLRRRQGSSSEGGGSLRSRVPFEPHLGHWGRSRTGAGAPAPRLVSRLGDRILKLPLVLRGQLGWSEVDGQLVDPAV